MAIDNNAFYVDGDIKWIRKRNGMVLDHISRPMGEIDKVWTLGSWWNPKLSRRHDCNGVIGRESTKSIKEALYNILLKHQSLTKRYLGCEIRNRSISDALARVCVFCNFCASTISKIFLNCLFVVYIILDT